LLFGVGWWLGNTIILSICHDFSFLLSFFHFVALFFTFFPKISIFCL